MRGERIPTPVTRSLARNDRNRRRDTWVPPYRVQCFYGADRVVRPYECSADVLTRRRDTRVPPYRVQPFYGAGRAVRPYLLYKEKELPEGSSF